MANLNLAAPPSYWVATKKDKGRVCNGCGAKGMGWTVPDTMYGMSVRDCCDIHDWMYEEGTTLAEKEEADKVFYENCLRKIKAGNWFLRPFRTVRAWEYYKAVSWFGKKSFNNSGKKRGHP